MPYRRIADLPVGVQHVLPAHAQHIYLAAYNQAWDTYRRAARRRAHASREETAHRVAWGAVKRSYRKDAQSGLWHRRH
ncbi:ChaB family protein [Chitinimonas sp.]|uniref:ChaB family protein n=1 Tax=Chitinimonas sp. TaxID=1934313 RepID=UPI002F925BB1